MSGKTKSHVFTSMGNKPSKNIEKKRELGSNAHFLPFQKQFPSYHRKIWVAKAELIAVYKCFQTGPVPHYVVS